MSALCIETGLSGLLVCVVIGAFLARFGQGRLWWPLVVVTMLLDQATKAAVPMVAARYASHPGVAAHLQVVHNRVQGFGQQATGLLPLVAASLCLCMVLYHYLAQARFAMSGSSQVGLALVMGGILSIATDRLTMGYTSDFIWVRGSDFVYNVADLAAIAGVALLCCRGLALAADIALGRAPLPRRPAEGMGD